MDPLAHTAAEKDVVVRRRVWAEVPAGLTGPRGTGVGAVADPRPVFPACGGTLRQPVPPGRVCGLGGELQRAVMLAVRTQLAEQPLLADRADREVEAPRPDVGGERLDRGATVDVRHHA